MQFEAFPKMGRLSRACIITEKIDGTNAQIHIVSSGELTPQQSVGEEPTPPIIAVKNGLLMFAGSRSKYLAVARDGKKADDNFGFAGWVERHADELFRLGPGRHYGEWWGSGIQRGYGLLNGEKRFSLFNTAKWEDDATRPSCCSVVPVLGACVFSTAAVESCLSLLRETGSVASPGFMNPEGVVIYHMAAGVGFKKTLEKDDEPKSKAVA